MKRLVIIDGKSVLYRGYYAMGNLSMSDGTPTGGVYGFTAMLMEILHKLQPKYVAVAWDKSKTNIRARKEIYPEYKANRKPAPEDFYAQIPYLMELLEGFNIPLYEYDDFEADDIMGALACKATKAEADLQVDLVSGDLDMLQIVGERIDMYRLVKGFSDVEKFDVAAVEEKYGLKKDQFLDLKALKGDSSDNIPGVPGIGEKGAVKLLQEWGTLDNIYAHVNEISGKVGEKLKDGKELAYTSKKLAEIRFDAPVEFEPEKMDVGKMDSAKVLAVLDKLEFKSLIRKFVKERGESKPDSSSLEDTLHARPSSRGAGAGVRLEVDDGPSSLPQLPRSSNADSLKDSLRGGVYVSWDVKREMHDSESVAEKVLGGENFWDLGQGEFLLDPLKRRDEQAELATGDVLKREYEQQIKNFESFPRLRWVAENLDFPLIPILYKMEKIGIKIDVVKFTTLKDDFTKEAEEIEQKIYAIVGHPFNIGSPMQLSEVLYGELGLPTKGIKKKQRFYSTGQKELDKLRGLNPIIELIERMREVTKLLNTYVVPLPALADEGGRVHTTYTQNVTATGRLSSVNPNLQNIPVRTEEGRKIRTGFIAGEGKVFVSADYAQFELRLAAALSGDEKLVADFNSGIDIHTKTASDVFKVPMNEVTKEQRRAAKVINFGVLYGMSAKGLSDAAGMSVGEAKTFIEKYFELRKPIREFLDKTLAHAKEYGFVETVFGRRRPTPDVKSPNYIVRAGAERAAMNMPIQGTEADLMKVAMIRVDKKLPDKADLLLQVHDSLVIECDEGIADEVGEILQREMEGVAPKLPVKLAVEVSIGNNWGEL